MMSNGAWISTKEIGGKLISNNGNCNSTTSSKWKSPLMKLSSYFLAVRPWSLSASLMPTLLGSALAYRLIGLANFSWISLIFTLYTISCVHGAGNVRYPENYKVMCPYNATHRLFKHELEEHVITCPMRIALEAEMYSETKQHGATNFPLPSEISSTIDSMENWDVQFDNNSSTFLEEKPSVNSNAGTSEISVDIIPRTGYPDKQLRAPRGFSEAMLREPNEDSSVEDLESIVSSMGIGRGKVTWKSDKLKSIGLGRGKAINSDL